MADETPIFDLPYPESNDPVKDGATAIQALAEQVEAVLADVLTVAALDLDVGSPWVPSDPAPTVARNATTVTLTGSVTFGGGSSAVIAVLPPWAWPAADVAVPAEGFTIIATTGEIKPDSSITSADLVGTTFAPALAAT